MTRLHLAPRKVLVYVRAGKRSQFFTLDFRLLPYPFMRYNPILMQNALQNFGGLINIILLIPALIIGITFHEFSHGLVASWLGDPTPKNRGRLTLNPIKHLDVIGSLMLVMVHFGWAKPMPINPNYFKDQRKGMAITGLAGPVANGIMAVAASLIIKFIFFTGFFKVSFVLQILIYIIEINLILGLFNLIPIPPLDGSRILAMFLPPQVLRTYYAIEPYGIFILILALVIFRFPLLALIGPPLHFFERLLIPY